MYSYLSETQKLVIDSIEKGDNVFITGAAGTGKSYLLHFLKDRLKNKNIHITATTGIAAINIGGVTLHSWTNLSKEDIPVIEIAKKILSVSGIYTRKKIINTQILAIDEVSMLSKETFENLDLLLKLVRDNEKPFGDIQILLFGDFFQLPPVNSKNFCFESNLWQEANIKTFILKETFRQKNERFINLLDNIRHGFINEDDKKTMYYKDDTADSWTKEEINFFEYSNSYSYAKDSLGIERDFCGYLKCLADEFDKATTEVDGKYIVRESYSVEGTMQLWMEKGMLFIEWNEDGGDHIITIYDVDKTKIDYPEELKNAATD